MSVSSEYFTSRIHPGAKPETEPTAESQLDTAKWIQLGLGAVGLALYLPFTVFTVTTETFWPAIVGPFVLFAMGRLMGLRSLWH